MNGKTGDRYAAKAFKRAGDRRQRSVLYADELSAYQHGAVLPCAVFLGLVLGGACMVQHGVFYRLTDKKLAAWALWGVCIAASTGVAYFAGYIQGALVPLAV